MADLRRGFLRLTIVMSVVAAVLAFIWAWIAFLPGDWSARLFVAVLTALGIGGAVWLLYWVLRFVIVGFVGSPKRSQGNSSQDHR